jgi:hypothetical protein
MAKPERGKVVVVPSIPQCDFCTDPGIYDFKSTFGPWAHGCEVHYHDHAQYSELGEGKGQLWITVDQVDAT